MCTANNNIIIELFLFSDGCPGRNAEYTTACFLLALASSGRFQNIVQYFPLRGSSFNDCDSDFAAVKRKIPRRDRINSHEENVALIKDTHSNKKEINIFILLQMNSFLSPVRWKFLYIRNTCYLFEKLIQLRRMYVELRRVVVEATI